MKPHATLSAAHNTMLLFFKPSRLLRACLLGAVMSVGCAADAQSKPVAGGASATLDDGQFIDGLRRYGLSDLLLYYANHHVDEAGAGRGAAKELVEIAGHRLTFDDADRSMPERAAALESAIAALESLIDRAPDDAQQPIWLTDLAEMLLLNELTVVERLALDFASLGVPTLEQLQAFESGVSRAAFATQLADERLYELQGTLPLQKDYHARYIQTGLADRLFENYGQEFLPFYEGLAAFYASMLGESAVYWQMKDQLAEAEETVLDERRRLLQLADVKLSAFIRRQADLSLGYGRTAKVARAMVQTRLGQTGLSVRLLDEVISEQADDLAEVRAVLAKAESLVAAGQSTSAERLVDQLASVLRERHPDWMFQRLLVADAHHRLLQANAQGPLAMSASYRPYDRLIASYASEERAGIKQLIAERWAQQLETSEQAGLVLTDVPVPVRLSVSRFASQQGYRLVVKGETQVDQAMGTARLEQAKRVAESLIGDEVIAAGLQPDQHIAAQYDLAVARIGLKPNHLTVRIESVRPLIAMAKRHPGVAESEKVIADATRWLRQMHAKVADEPGAFPELDDAMRDACRVLLTQYPMAPITDATRLYFAAAVLFNADKAYSEAAEVLAGVPMAHEDYFAAQALRMRCMWLVAKETQEQTGRPDVATIDELSTLAQKITTQAVQPRHETNASAREALIAASLAQAQARFLMGDAAGAAQQLGELMQRYPDAPSSLVSEAMQTQLSVYAAAGDDDALTAAAEGLMASNADQAAAILTVVLDGLQSEIDGLKLKQAQRGGLIAEELGLQIARRGSVAHALAAQLLGYAQKDEVLTPEQRLHYQLLEAKTLWLKGDAVTAVKRLEKIEAASPDSLPVVFHASEARYLAGNESDLREPMEKAFVGFARIDKQYKNDPKPPGMWWHARLRQIQIVERLKTEGSRAIVRNILQLEDRDPGLGGPMYAPAFKRLLVIHRPLAQ